MKDKQKHLEFIQAVINRMANNSFIIKGWMITLVVALFALFSKHTNKNYIAILFLPVIAFWVLDSYFLSRERAFRRLYDKVRKQDEKDIDFSMDISNFEEWRTNWFYSIFSKTILFFYAFLVGVMLIILYLIN